MTARRARKSLARRWQQPLDRFRATVAHPSALPQLALLGVLCGLAAGTVILAFRLSIEWLQTHWLPGNAAGDFRDLAPHWRFLLPLAGGVALGLALQAIPEAHRRVGVLHLIERLAFHQGKLPWQNALVQFFGGIAAIVSGQSVGREGPSAHLGASAGSLPGQWLQLPHNSLRLLMACGAAAGIAASFNTPLAGTVFALEVIVLEYTVVGFAPVILAAVSATVLLQAFYGDALEFTMPALKMASLTETSTVVMVGLAGGVAAAVFVRLLSWFSDTAPRLPVWLRLSVAGLIMGVCGYLVPEVMGVSYASVSEALRGELLVGALLGLLVFKLLASSACVGLGIPGGLIGPSLVIGAAAGALVGSLAVYVGAAEAQTVGLFALLGMGATMAGVLQAPLAALLAIFELTGNPNVILPGMLAVIIATIVRTSLQGRESVFHVRLRALGLNYRDDPLAHTLRRVGVAGVMSRAVATLARKADREQADSVLDGKVEWILVRPEGGQEVLLEAVDLGHALKQQPEMETFDLLEVPGVRLQAAPVDFQATLQEAREQLENTGAEALYVTRLTVPGLPRVYGVITREHIERGYRM